jgi:hypothetical protein
MFRLYGPLEPALDGTWKLTTSSDPPSNTELAAVPVTGFRIGWSTGPAHRRHSQARLTCSVGLAGLEPATGGYEPPALTD